METTIWTSTFIDRPSFYHYSMLYELSQVFGVKPQTDLANKRGTHIFFMLARELFLCADWLRELKGPKIIIEHDAYLNFMPESIWYRSWSKLYQSVGFDLIISSGKKTTEKLCEAGLPAVWIPKGCNPEYLEATNKETGKIGYFSTPIAEQETGKEFHFYRSRHDMCRHLQGLIPPIACSFGQFPETISNYSMAITNDATMEEPMAKQFECSALGCVVMRDRQEELYELGYEEGKSVVSYDNPIDLLEKLDYYKKSPEKVIEMSKEARKVAMGHTWRHRAKEVYELAKPYRRKMMVM